jgi:hypothetical protein
MTGSSVRSKSSENIPHSGLVGGGVLVIWNAIAREHEALFNDWYTREHVPERLSVPGFLRARRYAGVENAPAALPQYMTLYETRDASVLASAPYLDKLNNPTKLTVRVLPFMQHVVRAACTVILSAGRGIGGSLGTMTFGFDEAQLSQNVYDWLTGPGVRRLLEDAEVLAVHYCATDVDTTALKDQTREQAAGSRAAGVHSILAVESTTVRALISASRILSEAVLSRGVTSHVDIRLSHFDLMLSMEGNSR